MHVQVEVLVDEGQLTPGTERVEQLDLVVLNFIPRAGVATAVECARLDARIRTDLLRDREVSIEPVRTRHDAADLELNGTKVLCDVEGGLSRFRNREHRTCGRDAQLRDVFLVHR